MLKVSSEDRLQEWLSCNYIIWQYYICNIGTAIKFKKKIVNDISFFFFFLHYYTILITAAVYSLYFFFFFYISTNLPVGSTSKKKCVKTCKHPDIYSWQWYFTAEVLFYTSWCNSLLFCTYLKTLLLWMGTTMTSQRFSSGHLPSSAFHRRAHYTLWGFNNEVWHLRSTPLDVMPFLMLFKRPGVFSPLYPESLACPFSSTGEGFDGSTLGLATDSCVLKHPGRWHDYEASGWTLASQLCCSVSVLPAQCI